MKLKVPPWYARFYANEHILRTATQLPLPHCLDTLPKLLTIEGQGRGLAGPAPLALPEEPAHE